MYSSGDETMANGHGGAREGAGRPPGPVLQNHRELIAAIIASGQSPLEALLRIAKKAEEDGDVRLALDAYGKALPYVHPRPKPMELDPEEAIELQALIAEAKVAANDKGGKDDMATLIVNALERKDKFDRSRDGQGGEESGIAQWR